MTNVFKAALFSASVLALSTPAHAEILNADLLDENATIVENAAKIQNFSTLVAAVQAAGLSEALMGEGPFTIFAPTDEAFAALGEDAINDLLKPENRETLSKILQSHVVPGMYTSGDIEIALLQPEDIAEDATFMSDGEVLDFDTLVQTDLLIERTGSSLYVNTQRGTDNNARVIEGDIMTSNGVIHVIDTVLIPAS